MATKRLYLLRHAKSSWDEPDLDDHDRPLNERGHRAARLMAGQLTLAGMRPDLVLCSTARRTRDTLAHLAPTLDGVPVLFERRLYAFAASRVLARLREVPESSQAVLVVGHNPALHELALALTDEASSDQDRLTTLREKFPTAALATLEIEGAWSALEPGCARLAAFVRPKELGDTGV